MTTTIDVDRVMQVWELCSAAYLHHGRRLQFPSNTDPTKTYQWRYLQRLALQLQQWEFDLDTSRRFIELTIDYGQRKGLLRKGLSLLCQGNLLQLCYQQLQRELEGSEDKLLELRRAHQWLMTQVGNKPAHGVLLTRPSRRAYCNLVTWYQQQQLSPLYLALSRACGRASQALDEQERQQLPDQSQLYLLRCQFVQDQSRARAAHQLLGDDCKC